MKCPWCNTMAGPVLYERKYYQVVCMSSKCEARGPKRKTSAGAMAAFARVAKK